MFVSKLLAFWGSFSQGERLYELKFLNWEGGLNNDFSFCFHRLSSPFLSWFWQVVNYFKKTIVLLHQRINNYTSKKVKFLISTAKIITSSVSFNFYWEFFLLISLKTCFSRLSLRIEPGNSSPRLVSSKEDLAGIKHHLKNWVRK